jgi:hypothetical protein
VKAFRKHVAIAIDGGGIKGIVATRALAILEAHLGCEAPELFRLTAGTSTGSIIAAGLASGLNASTMTTLYTELGPRIFGKTWRSRLWPLTRYRYPLQPLADALRAQIGDQRMGDFWTTEPRTDVVITAFDVVANRTRFIKPWKPEYARLPVVTAVLASSSVPTYFPVVENRYIDGGVGSYANPCYVAAYEACLCLGWPASETTLISLGTGRDPHGLEPSKASRLWPWQWLNPVLGAFMQSADDQQVHLVETFFQDLDFRRYQIDLRRPIAMDDPTAIPQLLAYGEKLGHMLLEDRTDRAQAIRPEHVFSTPQETDE